MKKFATVLALLSFMGLVGCLEYNEQVSLNKDGSGSTQLRFALSKQYLEQMKELSQAMAQMKDGESEPAKPPTIISSEEEIKAFFSVINSGAKLTSYAVSETDSFRVWNLSFTFTQVSELDHVGASVFQDEEDEDQFATDAIDAEQQSTVTYTKQGNGTWLFTRIMPDAEESGAMEMDDGYGNDEYAEDEEYSEEYADEYSDEYPEEEEGEESSAFGAELEAAVGAYAEEMGLAAGDPNKPAVTLSVTFPGKVVESNASLVDANTATWTFTLEQISGVLPAMTASIAQR